MAGPATHEALSVRTMEAVLPEVGRSQESYWQSLRQIKVLGRFAVGHELNVAEAMSAREEALVDFMTGVQENLATDKEYGEMLSFEPWRELEVREGQVINKNGEPVVELVKRGWQQSKELAQEDSRYQTQAVRDEGDFMVARTVDRLEPGEMYTVVSMDPKEAIARDGRKFWESKMHYRDGMAVVQVYYRKDANTLLAGAYSVKQSDKAAFARILNSHGMAIDADTPSDYWTRYGIRKAVSLEEATAFGLEVREAHRKEIGQSAQTVSVTELMKVHNNLVTAYFDTYIVPLAEASVSRRNNITLQSLAGTLLAQSHVFKPEVIRSLMKVNASSKFDDADTRFMEEMVRYALIEDLRTHLKRRMNGQERAGQEVPVFYDPQVLHMHIAQNVVAGTAAGRSYGGCSGAGGMGKGYGPDGEVRNGPQDIFGGDTEGDEKKLVIEDEFGSLTFECPKGHENTRLPGKLIDRCKKCGTSVRCD